MSTPVENRVLLKRKNRPTKKLSTLEHLLVVQSLTFLKIHQLSKTTPDQLLKYGDFAPIFHLINLHSFFKPQNAMIKIKVEFLGGLDIISNKVREHRVSLPLEEGEATMKDVIEHITKTIIADEKDIPVFLEEGTVRPGILVLINDTDWELEEKEEYVVESGDVFTFTSTLHGG